MNAVKFFNRYTRPELSRFAAFTFLATFLSIGVLFLGFNKSPTEILFILFLCTLFQLVQSQLWPDDAGSIFGTLITGLGLSILINTGHDQILFYAFPCFIAIASKVFFRFRSRHIFNPSLVAIIACLLFTQNHISVTPAYQWGGQNWFSVLILLPAVLIVLPLTSRAALSLSFVGTFAIFLVVRSLMLEHSLPFATLFWSSITSPAFFLFACFMITDPPTSPVKIRDQIVVGVAIGTVDFIFHLLHSYYTFFFAAALVASSRFFYLRYQEHGLPQLAQAPALWFRQSKGAILYFIIGALCLNPVVWAALQTSPVKTDLHFAADSTADALASSPMVAYESFPIDQRLQHLTKWLISSEGVAVGDVNGDGRQDVFLLNSLKERRGVFLFATETGWRSAEDPVVATYLNDYKTYGLATSATFSDYDGDGDLDLFITFIGGHNGGIKVFRSLLAQTSELKFEEASAKIGLADYSNSLGLTLSDFDGDGRLDLFLTTFSYDYLPGYADQRPFDMFSLPAPEYPGDERPTRFLNDSWYNTKTSAENRLYRQTDAGFERIPSSVTNLTEHRMSLAAGSSDLNRDGRPDIYVADDSGPDELYINEGGFHFRQIKGANSREIGADYYKGMDVTFADFNRDGRNEIYVSNTHHPFVIEGSLLWDLKFDANANFVSAENHAASLGLLNEDRWGWSAAAADFDLDGRVDLAQANGMFDATWEKSPTCLDYYYLNEKLMRADARQFENAVYWADTRSTCLFANELNRLSLQQPNGHFRDVAKDVGLTKPGVYRGVATVDFKNDGRLGLIFTSPFADAQVFKQDGLQTKKPEWIGFSLESLDRRCDRSAINSFVEITSPGAYQFSEKLTTNGFSAQSDTRVLFGLGSRKEPIDITVTWCGKFKVNYKNLATQRYHHLTLTEADSLDVR